MSLASFSSSFLSSQFFLSTDQSPAMMSWSALVMSGALVTMGIVFITSPQVVEASRFSNHPCCLLVPPPAARMAFGMEDGLRQDCIKASSNDDGVFQWEPKVSQGYRVAQCVFDAISSRQKTKIWFPLLSEKENVSMLEKIVSIVNDNSIRLDGVKATSSSWPKVPATVMDLSFVSGSNKMGLQENGKHLDTATTGDIEKSAAATIKWVDETLCRLNLCPYTLSAARAAVGLESVGVSVGPVVVRHASADNNVCRACTLASSFWSCVTEMATTREEDISTILLIAPPSYDDDFVEFAKTCDELIQPVAEVTGANDIVGRAWFHPLYKAQDIGHDTILPGHALPASMVEKFVDQYYSFSSNDDVDNRPTLRQEEDQQQQEPTTRPDSPAIARANDCVRWTPHATINLLRRSQLNAAKKLEAASANKRPNYIYARNVIRILRDWDSPQDNE